MQLGPCAFRAQGPFVPVGQGLHLISRHELKLTYASGWISSRHHQLLVKNKKSNGRGEIKMSVTELLVLIENLIKIRDLN